MLKKAIALILVIDSIAMPLFAAGTPNVPGAYRVQSAVTPPPANKLPDLRNIIQGATLDKSQLSQNTLSVRQTQELAILNWNSFDIGQYSKMFFNQRKNGVAQKDWVALNRIFDLNPSQIFGSLQADAKIYLINQNGILFGAGSQINVSSLIASSLNISNQDILSGVNRFRTDNYIGTEGFAKPGRVVNKGRISTGDLGSVFLMGPQVENSGSIDSPNGQIGLAAGEDIMLTPDREAKRQYYLSITSAPGIATNSSIGRISTDSAVTGAAVSGMYGATVNQQGVIRSVSTVKRGGVVELMATDRIVTGGGSYTAAVPSVSDYREIPSSEYVKGVVSLTGLNGNQPVSSIEHWGTIQASGADVTMGDAGKINLKAGSRVDVSGLWVDKAADANQIKVRMTSDNMSDDFTQKNGILKGKDILVDVHEGSAFGNLATSLKAEAKSVTDMSLSGGTISMQSLSGTVTAEQGSSVTFAGGGTRYAEGSYATTVLYSGGREYDIATADKNLVYDKVGERTRSHEAHTEGADAGELNIVAGKVAMTGTLDGRATRGGFQTLAAEKTDSLGRQKTRGLREPLGGKVSIGAIYAENNLAEMLDARLGSLVVTTGATPLSTNLGTETSYVWDETLSSAGLSSLKIFSNATVRTERGSRLILTPDGTLALYGRRIEHEGEVYVPSGSVDFTVHGNITSFEKINGATNPRYLNINERLFIDRSSIISTAGETIDLTNDMVNPTVPATHLSGGSISLRDITYQGSLVIAKGARVDASGGYLMDRRGGMKLGDGGSISLHAYTLISQGELSALGRVGKNGGSLTLHAGNVSLLNGMVGYGGLVTANSAIPSSLKGGVSLSPDTFENGGFANIDIRSANDLTIGSGITIASSRTRLGTPWYGRENLGTAKVLAQDAQFGKSSVKASAGQSLTMKDDAVVADSNDNAVATIKNGGVFRTGPGGEASVTSTKDVRIAGTIAAPGGKVNLNASKGTLNLAATARILAAGYVLKEQKPIAIGYEPGFTAYNGGEVKLDGYILDLDEGAVVDVSGSGPANGQILTSDGRIVSRFTAGTAGKVALAYTDGVTLGALFKGESRMAGIQGGGFSLTSRHLGQGIIFSKGFLKHVIGSGFDDYTFKSNKSLTFIDGLTLTAGRGITLNAPEITVMNNRTLSLSAPYVKFRNSFSPYLEGRKPAEGKGKIFLAGDWLDMEGSIVVSGVSYLTTDFNRDIRFFDSKYITTDSKEKWEGLLSMTGNLLLKGARIYPGMKYPDPENPQYGFTPSGFAIITAGNVTTSKSNLSSNLPIYSAGGKIRIESTGGNIFHNGILAAPMGTIELKGNRVYIGTGSRTATRGDAMVSLGAVDSLSWSTNGADGFTDVTKAPEGSLTITGDEVIVRSGSTIDISGGGKTYGYRFDSGQQGTLNPLPLTAAEKTASGYKNRFVILPDNSFQIPGSAVYLSGGPGLAAGVYSMLPLQYAFLPGAMVVTDIGTAMAAGDSKVTTDGFREVAGFDTFLGTGVASSNVKSYQVRLASEVLNEGSFTTASIASGNAGNLVIDGKSIYLGGAVNAAALAGYKGGSVTLGGTDIYLQTGLVPFPKTFNPLRDLLPDYLKGKLTVSSDFFKGKGLQKIGLGISGTTENITIAVGSSLTATELELTASKSVIVGNDSELTGMDSNGRGAVSITAGDTLEIGKNSLVRAGSILSLDTGNLNLNGDIRVDNGVLKLASNEVAFSEDGVQKRPGLFITQALWDRINRTETGAAGAIKRTGPAAISLKSKGGELSFIGNFALEMPQKSTSGIRGDLTLNAARYAAIPVGSNDQTVSVTAGSITLTNSGSTVDTATAADNASITFSADRGISVQGGRVKYASDGKTVEGVEKGEIRLDGFKSVTLAAADDLAFKGQGALKTDADLTMSGARVVTSYLRDSSSNKYLVADYEVRSEGAVTIRKGNGAAGSSPSAGGNLGISGKSIDIDGAAIDMEAGNLSLTATGAADSDGIKIRNSAVINARGNADYSGGKVAMEAATGAVNIEAGSRIDVSAGAQGDAGSIALRGAQGGVTVNGELLGNARGDAGIGGSLLIDTKQLDNFSALNSTIVSGGFTDSVDLRVRQGDLTIAATDTVKARTLVMAADSGAINLSGTIDASAADGGNVELYAGRDLNVKSGARINAMGTKTGGAGGEVILSSTGGYLNLEQDANIDVSGNGGNDGRVRFRSGTTADNSDVKMSLKGSITGARAVVAEGVRVESNIGNKTVAQNDYTNWKNSASAFMTNATGKKDGSGKTALDRLTSNLSGIAPAAFHLRPVIEVQATGDLNLNTALDLTAWRFNNEPGTLVLRAGNNLNINKNLVDHPTVDPANPNRQLGKLNSTNAVPSWDLGLVAGSDLKGASPYVVQRNVSEGKGKLSVANGTYIYSETGDIRLASAGDTLVGTGGLSKYMIRDTIPFSIGTYTGRIRGEAGRDMQVNGGAIQSATGAIDIATGRDLKLFGDNGRGSIRTTGENLQRYTDYWAYSGGGAITLDVGGSVIGKIEPVGTGTSAAGWDYAYTTQWPKVWAASYEGNNVAKGVVAMGGGDVSIRTGKDFTAQTGTFGSGNLTILSNGDMAGRFVVKEGQADLRSHGSFAPLKASDANQQVIELMHASASVVAGGDLLLGAVLNPTIANNNTNFNRWNLTYGPDSWINLSSRKGDVTIQGESAFIGKANPELVRVLPASLTVNAAGNVNIHNNYILAPAVDHTLKIFAGGSINGYNASLMMPDVDPANYYGTYKPAPTSNGTTVLGVLSKTADVRPQTYQAKNADPVQILAGVGKEPGEAGNIKDLKLYLTKAAIIDAEGDINDLYYFGQNRNATDTSVIRAGGGIKLKATRTVGLTDPKQDTGFIHGGPGNFVVQAGKSIGLGISHGIQVVGNKWNTGLPEQGSNLYVAAGYNGLESGYTLKGERYLDTVKVGYLDDDPARVAGFFDRLRTIADRYSTLVAEEDTSGAAQLLADSRNNLIVPLAGNPTALGGDINITNAEISSSSGGSISILANGSINVGVSSTGSTEEDNTGIYTSAGGGIGIYAKKDINVNQSRIMSFFGGDILLWSDYGNINAGKGSRTAISTQKPRVVEKKNGAGVVVGYELKFTPPKVGSGVRTVTYDPDGPEGPKTAPEAGTTYAIAPNGTIDAGEAGFGGNTKVVAPFIENPDNFEGPTVGLPPADAGVSLGSLSGMGNVTDSSKMIEQNTTLAGAKDLNNTEKKVDDFIASWLDVKVINFDSAPPVDVPATKQNRTEG